MSDLLELATSVQAIPAPSFYEQRRAEFARDFLGAAVPTELVEHTYRGTTIANLYAHVKGTNPSAPALLVSAHTDTVFPADTDLASRRDGDRLYGPGIGDNSLAVAALLTLAREATSASLPCDVYFVANACEEGLGDLAGARTAVDHLRSIHPSGIGAALVLEGMLLGGIYHAGIGVRRYRVTAEGQGGHSWGDYGRASAIHELTRAISRMLDLHVPSAPRTSINVGLLQGGTSVNTIAATASAEIDLRSVTQDGVDRFAEAVVRAINLPGQADEQEMRLHCEVIGDRPAGSIRENHPLVEAAIESLADVGVDATIRTGSTDANAYLAAGIPSVCVGITTGRGAHTSGEFIDIKPVSAGMEQVRLLVPRAASIAAAAEVVEHAQ